MSGAGNGDEEPRPRQDGDSSVKSRVQEVFKKVPAIGTKWRWYDVPYRALNRLVSPPLGHIVPAPIKKRLRRAADFFTTFHHLEQVKAGLYSSNFDDFTVPDDEHIEQGGIWVIEIFPPSRYADLLSALEKNGWDKEFRSGSREETLAEAVEKARLGHSFIWSHLGTIVPPDSHSFLPNTKRETLPEELSRIELSVVQIGTGITALVAFMGLSDTGQGSLDKAWRARYEPRHRRRGRSVVVERGTEVATREVSGERHRVHEVARSWMRDRYPGFFFDRQSGHPVVDFSIFAQHDPTSSLPITDSFNYALRALAFDYHAYRKISSPSIAGAVFVEPSLYPHNGSGPASSWGIVGARDKIVESNDMRGCGNPPYGASVLAARFNDEIRSFALHFAMTRFVDEMRSAYITSRDKASTRHRRYRPKRLLELRNELLANGLDVATIARDAASSHWRSFHTLKVNVVHPNHTDRDFELVEWFDNYVDQKIEELRSDDAFYRETLTTAASLGASVDASRLGKLALLVSGASLAVAFVTLLVANVGDTTLWSELLDWLRNTK